MADSRRDFFKKTAGIALAASALPFLEPDSSKKVHAADKKLADRSPLATATDENFWYAVQNAFDQSPQFINLDNGHHSPQPNAVIDEVCQNAREHNHLASFYNRRRINADRKRALVEAINASKKWKHGVGHLRRRGKEVTGQLFREFEQFGHCTLSETL